MTQVLNRTLFPLHSTHFKVNTGGTVETGSFKHYSWGDNSMMWSFKATTCPYDSKSLKHTFSLAQKSQFFVLALGNTIEMPVFIET